MLDEKIITLNNNIAHQTNIITSLLNRSTEDYQSEKLNIDIPPKKNSEQIKPGPDIKHEEILYTDNSTQSQIHTENSDTKSQIYTENNNSQTNTENNSETHYSDSTSPNN